MGYPKVTSAAYVALNEVVGNEASTDAEFKAAIDAYYNETDVLLPENKKWYKIASVNKKNERKYLAVSNNQVQLVDNIDEASAFEALDNSGVFTLGDADDNMLNVNGVTADAGAEVSKLRIAKLNGSAVQLESGDVFDADKALGTFSFKGSYPSVTGNSSVAYALCNHADNKYQTEADVVAPYWQSSLTSAFAFVEVEKPAAAIKTVETAYKLTPAIVESNADLGHYYIEELGMMEVPDYLADYIDYEAYGRDVAINEMGQFTDYGYVRDTQEYFTEYYDGDRENIPDEYRVMDFKVSGEKERKTMNYETFKQEFAEDIKEKLYERGYDDVRISFNNVEKTNQNYVAMSVVPEGNNVGVNFNIENAFASYEHTDDYAGVLASATMVIADGLDRAPAIDVSALMDYENMKEKLSVEVISADANADLLANVPHDRMEDLAVVYRFVMESSEDGRASILVTNNLMDRMGVSHEQLRADALENSPEIRPVVIMGMNEVMKEMIDPEVYEMFGIPDDAEETMYVATVPDKNSGAGVIAYQDFMDQAAERVGGDFFVLPSSINEILLVPDNGDMTADALRDMVKDVNAKEVSPEERLSDNVYHYDSKDHVFELAEKFEARQQEKKTEIDEKSEEKGSVLKDLKDKQKEAAAKPPVKDAAEKAAKSKGREVL